MRWLFACIVLGCGSSSSQPAQTIVVPPANPLAHHSSRDTNGDGIADDMDADNDKDGILDVNDRCPNNPGPRPDGCPRQKGADRDGDGIVDSMDKCPDDPEDHDGFQDADGCPDPDNDGDGILDKNDMCPNTAGPPPGGCP